MEVSQKQQKIQTLAEEKTEEAKEYIMTIMQPLILAVAMKYKNMEPMDDLIQQGNVHLLIAINKYDVNTAVPFLAFAKSQVTYGIFNYVRRQKNKKDKQVTIAQDDEPMWEKINDPSINIEESILDQEMHQQLMSAMDKLSVGQRDIIKRHYFEGEKWIEIAFEKGVHYKAVLQMKNRALQKLKEAMEDES